jgi:hypothetical protein
MSIHSICLRDLENAAKERAWAVEFSYIECYNILIPMALSQKIQETEETP